MNREALNMALEALEVANSCIDGYYIPKGKTHLPEIELAITAIKEALADTSPNFNCKSVQARLATAWGYVKSQPEQEPVACVTYKEVADTMNGLWGGTLVQRQIAEELENTMLYTTPPQRKPLTDEEIMDLCRSLPTTQYTTAFARAIEAAHGIKGEA